MVLSTSQGATVTASQLLRDELDRQADKLPSLRSPVSRRRLRVLTAALLYDLDPRHRHASYFGVRPEPSLEDLSFRPGQLTTVLTALVPDD